MQEKEEEQGRRKSRFRGQEGSQAELGHERDKRGEFWILDPPIFISPI